MKGTRTARAWAGMLGATLVVGPAATALSLVTARRWHRSDVLPRFFCHLVLRSCGARVVVRGMSRFDHHQNYVMAANHVSWLDPVSIVGMLPQKIRAIAKHELLWVPVFGVAAWATGNIFVRRERHGSARDSLQAAARQMGQGLSVLFFVEGTRSPDGSLGPFKPGAARMAMAAGVSILPMALAGTADILPVGNRPVRQGTVGLAVGNPIPVEGRTAAGRDSLTAEIRGAIEALLVEAEEARRTGVGEVVWP